MPRHRILTGGLLAGLCLLLWGGQAQAVIEKLTDLDDILARSTHILTARVESLDPRRPAMVLAVEKALKGKLPFKKLPVLLRGDAGARKRKEPPRLLERLAVKLPLVLFVQHDKEEWTVIGYSNGTWFRIDGFEVDDRVRGSFTNLEPYLRRTYAGTTAEMTDMLRDVLAGKRKAPKANGKEKPGLGPEVGKKGAWRDTSWGRFPTCLRKPGRLKTCPTSSLPAPPQLSVIPTVIVGGPLALLAMLFPTALGGWRRWLALLGVAATNSTLYTLQYVFATDLADSWWGTPQALWVSMTAVTVVGLAWAWWRHLALVQRGAAPLLPSKVELLVLGIASLIGLAAWSVLHYFEQPLLSPDWLPLLAFCLAVWAGTLYVGWRRLRGPRLVPALATEAVILTSLVLACTALSGTLEGHGTAAGLVAGEGEPGGVSPGSAAAVRRLWTFRAPAKGQMVATPLVAGQRVYAAVAHLDPFRRGGGYGTVYCLDRASGEPLWSFDDRKKMKIVYSSPCLAGGQLYLGEGFHEHSECKVYCLDAATGKKGWEFQTSSHTESTPAVEAGRLYTGAGDDGLLCLDAATGKKLWNVPGYHIDASPVVAAGRVYVGSGIGDSFQEKAFLCVDAGTGKVRWRIAADLPVWGRAEASAGRVFFGTSSARTFDPEPGRGEVRCVRADTGDRVWSRKLPGGVLGRLTLTRYHLYASCRDGHLYCLRRKDGSVAWKYHLGGPVEAGVALARCPASELPTSRAYVVAGTGLLACLGPNTGRLAWASPVASAPGERQPGRGPYQVAATPAIEEFRDAEGNWVRRLYVAATLTSSGKVAELHCYEDRTEVDPGE
jgi:outer membrane protein assembly factor BamB